MNINDIISSGILESYVLGNASPEEIKKVQEWEKLYPLIKEEIEAIEESLMEVAEEKTNAPSPRIKNKLMDELFSSNPKAETTAKPKVVAFTPKPTTDNGNSNRMLFAIAASIALLIGSSVINFILYKKLNTVQTELAQINAEKSVLADQFKVQQTSLSEKSDELAVAIKPGNKTILLKGLDISPASSATILWNTQDKTVFINVASLPLAPEGKQYQLWALVDGKPVDAGVFIVGVGNKFIQKMKDMPDAQAFAVTLEKSGGSATPTMEAMYLIGNI